MNTLETRSLGSTIRVKPESYIFNWKKNTVLIYVKFKCFACTLIIEHLAVV